MVEYFNFQEIFMKHLKCLLNSWYIFNLLTVLNSENSIILNSCQLSTELCDLCFNCRHYISMKLTYNLFVFSIYNNYRKLNYFIKFDFSSIFGAIAFKVINTNVLNLLLAYIFFRINIKNTSKILRRNKTTFIIFLFKVSGTQNNLIFWNKKINILKCSLIDINLNDNLAWISHPTYNLIFARETYSHVNICSSHFRKSILKNELQRLLVSSMHNLVELKNIYFIFDWIGYSFEQFFIVHFLYWMTLYCSYYVNIWLCIQCLDFKSLFIIIIHAGHYVIECRIHFHNHFAF